jgi:hypothetical protein
MTLKLLKLRKLYDFVEFGAVLALRKPRRRRAAVTQQAVERTLGKLLTDENFRDRFFTNPELASWEAGFTLSPIELDALSRLSHEALARLGEGLDKRISRASLGSNQGEEGKAELT